MKTLNVGSQKSEVKKILDSEATPKGGRAALEKHESYDNAKRSDGFYIDENYFNQTGMSNNSNYSNATSGRRGQSFKIKTNRNNNMGRSMNKISRENPFPTKQSIGTTLNSGKQVSRPGTRGSGEEFLKMEFNDVKDFKFSKKEFPGAQNLDNRKLDLKGKEKGIFNKSISNTRFGSDNDIEKIEPNLGPVKAPKMMSNIKGSQTVTPEMMNAQMKKAHKQTGFIRKNR